MKSDIARPDPIVTASILCGIFCGLAGAQLSLSNVVLFSKDMSGGRGFVALAVILIAKGKPSLVLSISLLFGLFDALSVQLQSPYIPPQFLFMLPYLVTIGSLVIISISQKRNPFVRWYLTDNEPNFTSSQIIEEFTEIEMDRVKGNTKSKRISDIRKIYIKFLERIIDLSNIEIANLLEIESSTVTNGLSGRYKENDFIIKSSMEIDKNVKLWSLTLKSLTLKSPERLKKLRGKMKSDIARPDPIKCCKTWPHKIWVY